MSREKGRAPVSDILTMIFMAGITIGLAWCVAWSLKQTIDFTIYALKTNEVGVPVGVIVQFWQQLALFARKRVTTKQEWYIWNGSFVGSYFLDAGTNVGQWLRTHPVESNPLQDLNDWSIGAIGWLFGLAIVLIMPWFEEALTVSLAATLHHLNVVLVYMDKDTEFLHWAEENVKGLSPFDRVTKPRDIGQRPPQQQQQQQKPRPAFATKPPFPVKEDD